MHFFFPADVGIIGGSDGPTAIFVAVSPSLWIWIGAGILAAICFWIFRKKKSK